MSPGGASSVSTLSPRGPAPLLALSPQSSASALSPTGSVAAASHDGELAIKIEGSASDHRRRNNNNNNGDEITNLSADMAVLMTTAGAAPSATTITEANRKMNNRLQVNNSNMAVGDLQTTLTSLDGENQYLNEIS